jgi:hypothetical protein
VRRQRLARARELLTRRKHPRVPFNSPSRTPESESTSSSDEADQDILSDSSEASAKLTGEDDNSSEASEKLIGEDDNNSESSEKLIGKDDNNSEASEKLTGEDDDSSEATRLTFKDDSCSGSGSSDDASMSDTKSSHRTDNDKMDVESEEDSDEQ